MSMLDGVSQCWPLAKDCVLWWDAWATAAGVVAAIVALCTLVFAGYSLIVTIASAVAVWRLGSRANNIAEAVQKTAELERVREAAFLRNYVYPEFVVVATDVGNWLDTWPDMLEVFLSDDPEVRAEAQDAAFGEIKKIDLELTKAVISRLHVITGKEGAAIAKALALSGIVSNLVFRMHRDAEVLEDFDEKFLGLARVLEDYLGHVQDFIHLSNEAFRAAQA